MSAPPVRRIASADNPLLVRLRKLARDPTAYRQQHELLVAGDHLCAAAMARGCAPSVALITDDAWATPHWRGLAEHAASVALLPAPLLHALQALDSPAPLVLVLPWQPTDRVRPDAPTLVLDRVQDAGNVGTVLRTAAAFGVGQVLALSGTAALWSPKVLRAGMGAQFGLHLLEGAAADTALTALALPLIATSPHAAEALHRVRLPWPCAWVVGHEGQGVAPALAARCSLSVRIAQPGGEESLNVAVAAALCLYESARQRDPD